MDSISFYYITVEDHRKRGNSAELFSHWQTAGIGSILAGKFASLIQKHSNTNSGERARVSLLCISLNKETGKRECESTTRTRKSLPSNSLVIVWLFNSSKAAAVTVLPLPKLSLDYNCFESRFYDCLPGLFSLLKHSKCLHRLVEGVTTMADSRWELAQLKVPH